jgi:hypothetical protein
MRTGPAKAGTPNAELGNPAHAPEVKPCSLLRQAKQKQLLRYSGETVVQKKCLAQR